MRARLLSFIIRPHAICAFMQVSTLSPSLVLYFLTERAFNPFFFVLFQVRKTTRNVVLVQIEP